MTITVRDLIDLLEQYDDDLEVRVAYQPNWPLRGTVDTVTSSDEIRESTAYGADDEDGYAERDHTTDDDQFVWISVGSAPYGEDPYAPTAAFSGTNV